MNKNIKRSLFFAATALVGISALSGCMGSKNAEVIKNNNLVSTIEQRTAYVGERAGLDESSKERSLVNTETLKKSSDIIFVDEDYISGEGYIVSKKKLPNSKNMYLEMTIRELKPVELADFLTERVGIHVRFSDRVIELSSKGPLGGGAAISPTTSLSGTTATKAGLVNIRYFQGSLSSLLDKVAIQLSSYWRYTEKNGIEFYIFDSVSYTLPRFASAGSWTLGNMGGSAATAGTQSYTEKSSTNSGIMSIIKGIKTRMSKRGSVDIDEHTSTITLTDTPPTLAVAVTYLEAQIKKMSQQILVRVDIYEVVRSNSNDKGMSVSAAFQSIKNSFSMVQATTGTIATPVITSTMAVLPSATGAAQPWDNSAVVFQALNQKGVQVTQRTGSTLIMNGEVAPIKDLSEISYIESLTSTTDPNSGALGVGQINGIANDGIEMTIVPLVQDNKKILLKLAVDINKVFFTTNKNGTQSTRNERKNIPLTVLLKDGATVVISGLSTIQVDRQDEGVGSSGFKWMGGKEKNSYKQSLMLISITPTMVNM